MQIMQELKSGIGDSYAYANKLRYPLTYMSQFLQMRPSGVH